ncbi:MAG: stage V sporulation protein T [Clostridia bacterium]|nr:stage V sporulation protein T [Clostridia bacterium]
MLLECGTVTKELLEESDFVGKAVNFKWDTESIAKATIVQKANHRTDKAFGVNVVCEGDPLEIFTAPDGEVIFKKYSPVGELSGVATQYAEVLHRGTNVPVLICDRDRVIACAGAPKKEVLDRQLSTELEDYMERRESFIAQTAGEGLTPAMGIERKASVAAPIIAAGDVSGAVVLLGDEKLSVPNTADIKLVQVAANFLGRQMEE